MDFVLELDTDTFIDLLYKASEEEIEEKRWQKYLMIYPEMEKGEISNMSFDEYKERISKPQKSKKTEEEILQDAENILKSMSQQ